MTEALELIHADPAEAVRLYRQQSRDPMSQDAVMDILAQPGMSDFLPQPQGTLEFAQYLFSTGMLKSEPKSWKDYLLPVAHDLDGS